MKVALPSAGDMVDGHFGHCEFFTIFTLDDKGNVLEQTRLDPPPGCGCKSNVASILASMGVSVMLAGNMGQGAVNVLAQNGIRVVRGCQGKLTDVVKSFTDGALADSGKGCTAHADGGGCGHHHH